MIYKNKEFVCDNLNGTVKKIKEGISWALTKT